MELQQDAARRLNLHVGWLIVSQIVGTSRLISDALQFVGSRDSLKLLPKPAVDAVSPGYEEESALGHDRQGIHPGPPRFQSAELSFRFEWHRIIELVTPYAHQLRIQRCLFHHSDQPRTRGRTCVTGQRKRSYRDAVL